MKLINKEELSVGDMKGDLLDRKPLPIGRTQFDQWSDRIIESSLIEASSRSLKQSLAHMIMHLAPTEAFKEDAYFILQLRKAAANQTAHMMAQEIQEQVQNEKKLAEATAPTLEVLSDGAVLEKEKL